MSKLGIKMEYLKNSKLGIKMEYLKNKDKIKDLEQLIKKYKEKSISDKNYYLLADLLPEVLEKMENGVACPPDLDFLVEMCKEVDEFGAITMDLGYYLKDILKNKNIYYLFDKVSNLNVEDLQREFSCGPVFYNVKDGSLCKGCNMLDLMFLKRKKGIFLVEFPLDLLDDDGQLLDDKISNIYYKTDDFPYPRIKPEYLLGYILNDNGLCKYFSKEFILNNPFEKNQEENSNKSL